MEMKAGSLLNFLLRTWGRFGEKKLPSLSVFYLSLFCQQKV